MNVMPVVVLLLLGCGNTDSSVRTDVPLEDFERAISREYIGQATMEEDGTIVLDLSIETPAFEGHSIDLVPPTDVDYQRVLDHLGGLKPGEVKPVRPFPKVWPDRKGP